MTAAVRLIRVGSVSSTNDLAARHARDGAPEGTVVLADRQTAGRGRLARPWVSEPGNLYASFVVRPDVPPARTAEVGFVAVNAVVDTVRAMLPASVPVRAKWPNDVLVDGGKISGMLLESAPLGSGPAEWLVVGIGVNLRHHPEKTPYPTTSVAEAGGEPLPPEDAVRVLWANFHRGLTEWHASGFAAVRDAWKASAAGIGEFVTIRLDRGTLSGVFMDLDTDGALILSQEAGTRRIAAGDLFLTT